MVLDMFGKAMEEVAMEDEADFQQLVGAEVVVPELPTKVLPRATHLLGEPCNASLLLGKLFFDEVSDVWGFVYKKGVNPFLFCLYQL